MTFKLFCVICDGPGYLPLKWDKGDKGEHWEDIKQRNNLRGIKKLDMVKCQSDENLLFSRNI